MTTFISFIIAITLIVFVHELGHYFFARLYGVRVIRFSIGFGKPVFKKVDSNGTQWVLSSIPLGGYVTMWDHLNPNSSIRSGISNSHENIKCSFSSKPFFQRFLIIAGGPLANFIFAIAAFTFIFSHEEMKIINIIDEPIKGSLAQKIGLTKNDKILKINDSEINSFEDIDFFFEKFNLDNKTQILKINYERNSLIYSSNEVMFELSTYPDDNLITKKFGLLPKSTGVKIIDVIDNSIAKKAGLAKGDVITSINNIEVNFPNEVTRIIKNNDRLSMKIKLLRFNNYIDKNVTPPYQIKEFNIKFKNPANSLGVYLSANTQKFVHSLNPTEAFKSALHQTFKVIHMCFKSLYLMFTGESVFDHLSGPFSIAKTAQDSINLGVISFISFLAVLSTSIGVINLLPIPILDGGHLLYHVIELVKGSPLSASFKIIGSWIGLFFIFGLTVLAVSRDIIIFLKL